jgi:N-ethylmaleimide reductase
MNSVFPLFEPLRVGAMEVPNRLFMAPLTRCRAEVGHVPGALMAEYYAQRATAGLIIAEATMAMEGTSAFYAEPGIYNEAQVAGWKTVTEAVDGAGGRIFLQIWHGGRACHPLLNNGAQPVAPSAIAITNDEVNTPEGKKPYVVPRELGDDELPGIVAGFKTAAENAKAAGFDGVEVQDEGELGKFDRVEAVFGLFEGGGDIGQFIDFATIDFIDDLTAHALVALGALGG